MARTLDPRIEQAKKLYDAGEKLIDIADQLGVPEGTIRSWKKRYWGNATLQKKECNVAKEKKPTKRAEQETIKEESEYLDETVELSEKQRLFCMYYIRSFNATKAYQKAYQCSYETAMANGSMALRNTKIQKAIKGLKQNRLNRELLDEQDIFQKYMDIAFADLTDYVEFGVEEIPVIGMYGPIEVEDPNTGKKVTLTQKENVVRFKSSSEIDGTLLTEVKKGKNGDSIKLADRMKALDWLANHMDLATEEQRARIEQIKAQTHRLTRDDEEQEETVDDGFLKALEGTAAEDWADEEES